MLQPKVSKGVLCADAPVHRPPARSRACLWLFDAACVALDASYSLTKYTLHAYDQWQTAAAEARGEVRSLPRPSHCAVLLCCVVRGAACVVSFTRQLRCRPLYAAGEGGVGRAHHRALLAAALHPPLAQHPRPCPLLPPLVCLNAIFCSLVH